jgi:hypothetical protein
MKTAAISFDNKNLLQKKKILWNKGCSEIWPMSRKRRNGGKFFFARVSEKISKWSFEKSCFHITNFKAALFRNYT